MGLPDLGRLHLKPSPSSDGADPCVRLPECPPWTHTGMKRDGNDNFAGGPRKRSTNGQPADGRKAPLTGQARKDHLAELERQKQERAREAQERADAQAKKDRTPEKIEADIKEAKAEQQNLNFQSMNGLSEEQVKKYQELEERIPRLEQQKVDRIAELAKEREALLHTSADTVEAMQQEISELRELEQKNPEDEELKAALQDRQWLVNDLKDRQEEEKAENQRKKNNEARLERRQRAIEKNDPSGLEGTKWWRENGKRQAAKWRIERCKEEALARRAQSAGAPAPAPAPPAKVEQPASTHSSKDDWERDINQQLKALGKLAVIEAQKQHKADEELFDKEDCYTEQDKQEQRERLARARGSGGASSSLSS